MAGHLQGVGRWPATFGELEGGRPLGVLEGVRPLTRNCAVGWPTTFLPCCRQGSRRGVGRVASRCRVLSGQRGQQRRRCGVHCGPWRRPPSRIATAALAAHRGGVLRRPCDAWPPAPMCLCIAPFRHKGAALRPLHAASAIGTAPAPHRVSCQRQLASSLAARVASPDLTRMRRPQTLRRRLASRPAPPTR
jgi:hypothetical protein